MAKFVLGLVCGLAIALGGTAVAANLSGPDSVLSGWTVTKAGEPVCKNPWADVTHQQIDCS